MRFDLELDLHDEAMMVGNVDAMEQSLLDLIQNHRAEVPWIRTVEWVACQPPE